MTVETIPAIRMTKVVSADRQTTWDAWTAPDHLKRWACPAPEGVEGAEVDLRVGGAYRIRMNVEGTSYTAFGTYREVDEPSRLVYTWDWEEAEHACGETTVTVEFAEVDGGTEISLTHDGFRTGEDREGHDFGWGACLTHYEAFANTL